MATTPALWGEVNCQAIDLLHRLREAFAVPGTLVSGMIGPRGDGYRPGASVDPGEAAEYHRPQLAAFRAAGADLAGVYTLTDPGEALGVALAAADVGLPLLVSFTVETDGRLPGGTSLDEAFDFVEESCAPMAFGVNCAHPRHLLAGLSAVDEQWRQRIAVVRCNASTATHAELDEADHLDDGDPGTFAAEHVGVFEALSAVVVRGGCCGTDARHVENLWGVVPTASGS